MEKAAAEFGALSEAVVFLDYFKGLADPRQRGKVVYPLDEVLLLCLLAVLGGAETFVDIARFGEKKLDLLRRFRPFRDGTPAHRTLGFPHCLARRHEPTTVIDLRRPCRGNAAYGSGGRLLITDVGKG